MVEGLNRNSYSRLLLADMNTKQSELGSLTRQISSGFKHEKYRQLAAEGNAEIVVSLQTKIQETATFQKSNSTIVNRLNVTAQSVDQLSDIAEKYAVLLAKKRSPSGDELPFRAEVTSFIKEAQNALNVTFEGRYLFSGSKTDTVPVADSVVLSSNLGDDNVPNSNYYQGDDFIATVQSSRSQNISYGVTASNAAFQDLIASFHLGLEADSDSLSETQKNVVLERATQMINDAVEGIVSVNAAIKGTVVRLENQNETFQSVSFLLTEQLQKITATDVVEASARLSENEAVLEATLYAFSILNRASLVDYL